MGKTVTLGGDRLGSGQKQKVHLHGYERSTHDLGYLWRSTISAGTLVPFMTELALPGDTFDINLGCEIMTHPTIGPLFGSMKVQLDVFQAPIRLYQGVLHNNKLGIGMNMSQVKLPQMELEATEAPLTGAYDPDNYQINPSCILSYLGIRGVGTTTDPDIIRNFNAIPYLAYAEIYKNYYANKQEEIGAVIHNELPTGDQTISAITINGSAFPQVPGSTPYALGIASVIEATYAGAAPEIESILINTNNGVYTLGSLFTGWVTTLTTITSSLYIGPNGLIAISWDYPSSTSTPIMAPRVMTFPLENIDKMREEILAWPITTAFIVNDADGGALTPYTWVVNPQTDQHCKQFTQEGLLIKTYQSDLFNNWLSTEWIDGTGGINEITAIDTSGGSFNIDTLNLSKKVYDMLNRIAVSGGTYDDWLDAVYAHERIQRAESPIYHGGLIKELIFQEVVSNSATEANTETQQGSQPLGTLAGKGVMGRKHKGGSVTIRVDEPSYLIGIISITPRLDFSQGNKWDTSLQTMDDFHKPALDEIGFQELIQEQMHWATTVWDTTEWVTKSAGKQPAWINYMTNVNQVRGNFAITENEMFMTLNRRYEIDGSTIDDLTTYIDPVKFNFIFAQTSIDAQNYWAQIAVDITARRKMSAKVMPNL